MNEELRGELLRMADDDRRTREELLRAGRLPRDNYSPAMRAVHERNNARMREIVAANGWPGRGLVGDEAGEAAWLVVHHAVLDAELQGACLPLLEQAVASDDAPAWQFAYLLDRVRLARGEPQVYGTQYVRGDGGGESVPWRIEDPAGVDERRRAVGLSTLAENTKRIRAEDEMLSDET